MSLLLTGRTATSSRDRIGRQSVTKIVWMPNEGDIIRGCGIESGEDKVVGGSNPGHANWETGASVALEQEREYAGLRRPRSGLSFD